MEQLETLVKQIQNPSAEFTPVPFWFFNDDPDEEKIAAQLADYVDKGVNAIVLHPRIGVPKTLEYLSEEYFKAIRFIVKTAHALDMKIVLYDEGMYPSGSAHGMVVNENPDYAAKGICMLDEKTPVPPEGKTIVQFEDGSRLVYCFTHGTIRGIHFGEDDGEPGAPAAADILNPDAVDTFIHLTHDQYYKHLKEYFGTTIFAFFTDEPSELGRCVENFRPWSAGMEEEMKAAGGKLEELKGLFLSDDNKTVQIYHKLIKKHLRETFYAKLSVWCEKHSIALMGHPAASDDIEEELYFHIPGQDLIMRRVSPETGGISEFDSVQAKLSADIARHLGRRRNANECFGVCNRNKTPWYFTASDMKWYLDWLGIRGVNLYVPHAFYYSVAGKRKDERPPDVGPNNIWWSHYRRFSDYSKRLSYLMTDSVNDAKVAVLCDNNQVPYRELAVLFENQVAFHYLPVALLKNAYVQNGKLCIGAYQYEVVLNGLNLSWNEYIPKGADGSIVPIMTQTADLVKQEKWHTVKLVPPCKGLRVAKLNKLGTTMYLLSNESEEVIQTTVPVFEKGVPIIADLWKNVWYIAKERHTAEERDTTEERDTAGKNEKKRYKTIEINLLPRETQLVLFASDDVPESLGILPELPKDTFLRDWTSRFLLQKKEKNRAIYQYNYEQYDKVVRTGVESFSVSGEEMVECYCNGTFVDVSFWNPHKFQIGPFLKEGSNQITLVVTGNAANIYSTTNLANKDTGEMVPYGLI